MKRAPCACPRSQYSPASVRFVHHGALGAEPLQRELGVPVGEALDIWVDGLDLLALLDEALLAVVRADRQPRMLNTRGFRE